MAKRRGPEIEIVPPAGRYSSQRLAETGSEWATGAHFPIFETRAKAERWARSRLGDRPFRVMSTTGGSLRDVSFKVYVPKGGGTTDPGDPADAVMISLDGSPEWPALEIVDTWNGFSVPRVTPAVRDRIATWLEHDEARDGPIDPEEESAADEMRRIKPQPDGSIVLRGFAFSDSGEPPKKTTAREELGNLAARVFPGGTLAPGYKSSHEGPGGSRLTVRTSDRSYMGAPLLDVTETTKSGREVSLGSFEIDAATRRRRQGGPISAELKEALRAHVQEPRSSSGAAKSARAYYYLRHGSKTVGGPYQSIQALAKGARRKLEDGQQVEAKRLVAGQWADLTEAEAEAVAALL